MKKGFNIIFTLSFLITFLATFSFAASDSEKPKFTLEVKDQLISISSEKANFKDILKELENKAEIKITIFEDVPDQEVKEKV